MSPVVDRGVPRELLSRFEVSGRVEDALTGGVREARRLGGIERFRRTDVFEGAGPCPLHAPNVGAVGSSTMRVSRPGGGRDPHKPGLARSRYMSGGRLGRRLSVPRSYLALAPGQCGQGMIVHSFRGPSLGHGYSARWRRRMTSRAAMSPAKTGIRFPRRLAV